jgi:peptide deformylase
MEIIKNRRLLQAPIPVKDISTEEIENITKILTTEIIKHGGIGLSANQLGLDVRACIINVIGPDPLVLINPRIVERSTDTIAYVEQCLSDEKSMKKPVKTVRHKTVAVECDNLGRVEFAPTYPEGRNWKTSEEFFSDTGLLECVCVQHEIDHLDGILMTDSSRKYSATVIAPKKYGRNERVMLKLPSGETEFMKYKKALPMLKYGCEIL